MCYLSGSSVAHFACFACRKVFRLRREYETTPRRNSHPCPDCCCQMANMGPYFKTPKRLDRKQWAKVRVLADYGYRYHPPSCCNDDGPGPRPRQLNDVAEFVAPIHDAARELAKYRVRQALRAYRQPGRKRRP